MAGKVELEVPEHLDGARLDKAVAELLGVSRAIASDVVGQGASIDGLSARASDRVQAGAVVTCAAAVDKPVLEPEEMALDIVYEDDEVVIINKAPGLVVHPGSGRASGTLAAGLLFRYPDIEGVGDAGRWGLIHRLDKDTSGALLVARTQPAFDSLRQELQARKISRTYATVVEGRPKAPTGTIDAPIARDPSQPTRRALSHGGKRAVTHFEVHEHFENADVSWLIVRLETGRTHQIRVHLAGIGHPVVGDWTYGATRRTLLPPRTLLHASHLVFTHPTDGGRLEVVAPLPADFTDFLRLL